MGITGFINVDLESVTAFCAFLNVTILVYCDLAMGLIYVSL